tara:strand:+ start:46420 stop:46914 length:495 start_codon:yes stop_codon:yes gene_type:complete
MSVMKKDVNFVLLGLIIVSILLFSGFTVYYHTTFQDVSLEYQQKLDELGTVTQELSSKRQELNETYSLRVKAEQDKKALDLSYKDLSDERDRLENDKISLQTELGSTKLELGEKAAQLQSTRSQLASTQSELSSVKARKNSLENDLDEVCAAYESATGSAHDEC